MKFGLSYVDAGLDSNTFSVTVKNILSKNIHTQLNTTCTYVSAYVSVLIAM